jgi:hypothetical protein
VSRQLQSIAPHGASQFNPIGKVLRYLIINHIQGSTVDTIQELLVLVMLELTLDIGSEIPHIKDRVESQIDFFLLGLC